MQNRPSADELLEALEEFLRDEVMVHLEGRRAFHARVATNVVGILRRELANAEREGEDERERIAHLLDLREDERDLYQLNVELCRRIREGEIDPTAPELLAHLRRTTLAKLAVDNPRYEAYRRQVE